MALMHLNKNAWLEMVEWMAGGPWQQKEAQPCWHEAHLLNRKRKDVCNLQKKKEEYVLRKCYMKLD